MRAKEIKNDAVGFSAQVESSTNTISATAQQRIRDPNRSCTHCNRKGHEAVECFLLHGYPDWFLEQQQQQRSAGSGQRGRGGRGARGRGRSNLSRTAPSSSSDTNASSEQIAALISLLQNQQKISTDRVSSKTKITDDRRSFSTTRYQGYSSIVCYLSKWTVL